jgi:DNA-binding transcriptional LysR family regulator
MELRQLEYFLAVAEEANFTRAAKRVHISQSGVSAQIRQLERELGATLIDRSGRTARLTSAGAAALDHARSVLAAVNAIRHAVDEVNGLIRGRLVVGMVTACTVTPLFDALAGFGKAHPHIELSLIEDNSDRLIERVRTGRADLALVGTSGTAPEEFEVLPLVSERLVAAVPLRHRLATRRRVSLTDIVEYPIICMPKGTGVRTVFDQGCVTAGIRADISMQASAPTAVADLAIRGLGIAILSESMALLHEGQLKALVIDEIETPAVLALIWGTMKSPALQELLVHCHRAFGQPSRPQDESSASRATR